jgi:hypothetical protein
MFSDLLDFILLASIANTIAFIFTTYILFFEYKLPIYHVMAIYQLYHFIGFVYRPWVLYFSIASPLWEYIGSNPTGQDLVWATLLTTVAHLTICAGVVATYPRRGGVPPIRPFAFSIGNPAAFAFIAAVLLGLGIYGSSTQFGNALNTDEILVITTEIDSSGGGRLVGVSGYQTVLAEFLPVTLLVLFAIPRTRQLSILLACCFIFYRLLVGAGRHEFIILIFSYSLILLINAERRFPPLKFVLAGLLLLAIFDNIGSDRLAFRKVIAGEMSISDVFDTYYEGRKDTALSSDVQEFDSFSSIIRIVPDLTGYTFGTQYLRLFIWPIPRFLWSDKPVLTSIVNLSDYGNYFGLTSTLYGDSYMTLGGVGMIAILFGISLYLNRLYKACTERPTPLRTIIYILHVAFSLILFRDGPVSFLYFLFSLGFGAILLCKIGSLKVASVLTHDWTKKELSIHSANELDTRKAADSQPRVQL